VHLGAVMLIIIFMLTYGKYATATQVLSLFYDEYSRCWDILFM